MPVRPAKADKQPQTSTAGLATRLRDEAGKLIGKPEEPEDEDLLVLSDDESQQGASDADAIFAHASLSLVGMPKYKHISLPGSSCLLSIGLVLLSAVYSSLANNCDFRLAAFPKPASITLQVSTCTHALIMMAFPTSDIVQDTISRL